MKEIFDGFTHTKEQADWRYCPRCGAREINRQLRRCNKCKGVVLWTAYDDGKLARERLDGVYLWHCSVYNRRKGWYDMSYFNLKNYTPK